MLSPVIKGLKERISQTEANIIEAGGAEYKKKKETLEQITQKVSDLERIINRMKSTFSNRDKNLQQVEVDIDAERKDIKKLEDSNVKLKDEIAKNEEAGTRILTEMGAIDTEKAESRNRLEGLKANFNQLKRDLANIEQEETRAKEKVEEALKMKN